MKLIDLTALKQWNDEPVPDFVQRFRDIRSRCYSLSLSDSQLAELAFQGLLPHIKEKFSSQEFDSLSHLAQWLSNVEVRVQTPRVNTFQKKVNNVDYSSDSEGEAEIGLAEWTKKKEPVSCPFSKKDTERYGSNVKRLIGSLTYCYRRDKLNCLPIIRSQRLKS
jgi:hypothetical protein